MIESAGHSIRVSCCAALIEVISPSSYDYDVKTKRQYYASMDTVRDYLVIYQDEVFVTIYSRDDADQPFSVSDVEGPDGMLYIPSIDISIALEELYRNVRFPLRKEDIQNS